MPLADLQAADRWQDDRLDQLPGGADYPAPVSAKLSTSRHEEDEKHRPAADLLHFRTTGEPKMVLHDHSYPLGHIVTARFWHDLRTNDLHFTLSDTGWAKSAWGKFYGQWIEGSADLCLRYPEQVQCDRNPPAHREIRDHHFLLPADHLPDADPRRPRQVRFHRTPPLHQCRRTAQPRSHQGVEGCDRPHDLEGYGQTETVLCIGTFPGMTPKFGSMGKPAPGWHIELHDDNGKPVGLHEEGRIAISDQTRGRSGCSGNT